MHDEPRDGPLIIAGAVAAAAIIVSAAVLRAPFLALLALPLVIGAVLRARGAWAGVPWLLAGGLIYTAVAASFVVSTGDFDWAAGDYVGILVGGPAALLTALLAGSRILRRPHPLQH